MAASQEAHAARAGQAPRSEWVLAAVTSAALCAGGGRHELPGDAPSARRRGWRQSPTCSPAQAPPLGGTSKRVGATPDSMTAPHELLRQVDEKLCSPDKWLRFGESDQRGAVLDIALHGDQLSLVMTPPGSDAASCRPARSHPGGLRQRPAPGPLERVRSVRG